ncbi:hypothetical protein AAD018_000820 [Aestuariibius insulae]|uniref:hypothetical protein n=1 Tax=Aestuariibius insulae TaxID=2058287 RepID=UPI00345E3D84
MPATLGHIGIQTVLTRLGYRRADFKWILLGCILPDLPWIGQRLAGAFTDLPPIEVRIYAIAQSSLAVSLLLCAALALFSRNRLAVFLTLAAGSLLHLLLDALQTKIGNGVLLFAPFDWHLTNFGLFWPEDSATLIFFALGLGVLAYIAVRERPDGSDLILPRKGAALAVLLLMTAYLTAPLALRSSVLAADLHDVATLADAENRTGKELELDRARLIIENREPTLAIWTRERLTVTGSATGVLTEPAKVSIRGRFESPTTLEVTLMQWHHGQLRDWASYLGLAVIALWWAFSLLHRLRR